MNWSDRWFPLSLPKSMLAKIKRGGGILLNRPLSYSPFATILSSPSFTISAVGTVSLNSWRLSGYILHQFLSTETLKTCQEKSISQLNVVLLANKYQFFFLNAAQLIAYVSRLLVQWFAFNFCICGSWKNVATIIKEQQIMNVTRCLLIPASCKTVKSKNILNPFYFTDTNKTPLLWSILSSKSCLYRHEVTEKITEPAAIYNPPTSQ